MVFEVDKTTGGIGSVLFFKRWYLRCYDYTIFLQYQSQTQHSLSLICLHNVMQRGNNKIYQTHSNIRHSSVVSWGCTVSFLLFKEIRLGNDCN